jgi:uncharacterized protein (TIGR00255 family)
MPAPIRSMTGFARVRRPLGEGELIVSVKTVNHRGLDIHTHAPGAADPFENSVRAMIKSRLARGHVDLRIVLPDAARAAASGQINRTLLEQYLTAFQEAAASHGLDNKPDLNAALRIPGMFGEQNGLEVETETESVLLEALGEALNELNGFREREGAEISLVLRMHNQEVAAAGEEIEHLRTGAAAAFQARLSERLGDLLKGVQIEPQRLAQEAAILADRSDVGEEVARLKIHSGQLTSLLENGGEVGKKLDFLLQEMNRETNTILSKTSGVGEAGLKITDLALAAKAAIEKIREQSLNIE